MTPAARRIAPAEVPGLAARRIATDILENVLRRQRPLDGELDADAHPGLAALADRDRALVRKLVATVLRRLGTLRHLLGVFLESGFPTDAPRVETVLMIGAAQVLFLDVPDHAAVDLSVRLVQADRRAARFPGLINAVLRRVTQEGPALLADLDTAALDTPAWLFERWRRNFGADTALMSSDDIVSIIKHHTSGRGADHVFEAVGIPSVQEKALECVRPGGTLTLAGLSPMGSCTNFPSALLTRQEKTIKGSYYGTVHAPRDFPMLLDLYKSGKLNLDDMITRRYTLDQVNEAYRAMAAGGLARGVIVL